jgi:NADPH-dependent 2,4-dienoyl-CoA reductase/sulfur reductase-like enzyme/rhodanese-related sulfurtransferase
MAETAQTIVIIGGVAGGASAAARARRCNEHARIIMFEKDEHVSFANCGLPYFIGGEIEQRSKLLVATPELFESRFRIETRTRHLVTAVNPAQKSVTVRDIEADREFEQPWDRLILAPGAVPIVPPIDGADADNVYTLRNLADADRIGEGIDGTSISRAVVVGAGFIGLEMVEQLHRRGIPCDLVELQQQVLPPLDVELSRRVEEELREHNVGLHLGDGISGLDVENGRASAVILSSGARLNADLVILGIGVRPHVELAKAAGLELGASGAIAVNEFMQTSHPEIYAVGDAVEYQHGVLGQSLRIPLAGPANRAGRVAGEHAATGKAQPMTPPVGTAIVRVFGITAGITGLSAKFARQSGIPNQSVVVSPKHHAGYFPGAETLTLKLTYDPESGRVLGAQAVGRAGIDKRIDVIATALRFAASVFDLAGLDLAYAPPFGAAKDPVHMAAFAACNDLEGLAEVIDIDADLSGHCVLDVRTQSEVERMSLTGSRHIPLHELRDRLSELDPDEPTIVVCHSGQRAHVATRILKQHGFREVKNLTGGVFMQQFAQPDAITKAPSRR